MIRNILFLSLLWLVFQQQTIAQTPQTCTVYEYLYRYGKPAKEGSLIEQHFYDKKGNVIKIQYYTASQSGRNFERFAYNNDGQLIQKSLFTKRERVLSTTKYSYHSSGLVLSEKEYDAKGKLIKKIVYTFPESKNMWTERNTYTGAGLISRTANTEIEDDKRLAGTVYRASGAVELQFKIKDHDSFGNEGTKVFFDEKGKYLYTYKRAWDKNNNITLKFLENKSKSLFYYDEQNRLSKEVIYSIETDEPVKLIRYNYVF